MEPVALSLTIQRQFAPGQSTTSTISCAAEEDAPRGEYHRLAGFGRNNLSPTHWTCSTYQRDFCWLSRVRKPRVTFWAKQVEGIVGGPRNRDQGVAE
jgi:hypothetical protein